MRALPPIQNARTSLALTTLRAIAAIVIWLMLPLGLSIVAWYGRLVVDNVGPEIIAVQDMQAPASVHSARGFQIAGLQHGGREWVEFPDISQDLVRAVCAAEDARFFRHDGWDPEGILRAFQSNMQNGDSVQGGSTITQQLAKSFVGDERTFARKIAELIVARRIESRFSKSEIFEAYINRIYFGAGATGIGAAAEIFFGVSADELDLAQSALLAAVVPAPGVTNPFYHPEVALERRDRVLDRLAETGLATGEEVARARAAPLGLRDRFVDRVPAPEVGRAVWHELDDESWRHESVQIHTGVDLVRQRTAQLALRDAVFALDQRQGLREHAGQLAPRSITSFREAYLAHEWTGEVRPAVVISSGDSLVVWAGEEIAIPVAGWNWAAPYNVEADDHGQTISLASEAYAYGDVVLLRGDSIVQWPRVEGAYGSLDIATGRLEAIVGGGLADRSDYDRYVQGCRQPGSTFKAILYSAALDSRYTPASILRDTPMRIELGPYEEWRPRNGDGSFDGHMTVWQAFIWSRNLPALEVYQRVGAQRTIARARELGITTELDPVESLALGASCVHPIELTRVYSHFANGGFGVEPRVLMGIEDQGQWHGDNASINWAPAALTWRLHDMWTAPLELERAIDADNAFQVSWLLNQVVQAGTGSDLRSIGFPVAGKTGTTNAYDAWFAGMTARDVAVMWIGSDENVRPLGRRESGGHLALPAWGAAALAPTNLDWPTIPAVPPGIEMVGIDPATGLLGGEGRWAVQLPFVRGTVPVEAALSRDQVRAQEIDRVIREF